MRVLLPIAVGVLLTACAQTRPCCPPPPTAPPPQDPGQKVAIWQYEPGEGPGTSMSVFGNLKSGDVRARWVQAPRSTLAPTAFIYAEAEIQGTVNEPISPRVPSLQGGAPTEFVEPAEFAPGLHVDKKTGVIWGTPTEPLGAEARTYTIEVRNAHGAAKTTVVVRVPLQ